MYSESGESPVVGIEGRRLADGSDSLIDNVFTYYDETSRDAIPYFQNLDSNDYIEVVNVRITPKQMVFTNPFEGKVFHARLTIRNYGKRPVLIRILSPTSSGIGIKSIRKGCFLCSGMSINRMVSYKVRMMTLVQSCFIPIYIGDDNVVEYPVHVTVTRTDLRIKPNPVLNFGQVDASNAPTKRTLTIRNNDIKPTRYSIDFGPNELELAANPAHGTILGEDEVNVVFTVIFPTEGKITGEFWIITDIPINIPVKANVGKPTIVPRYVPNPPCFTFVQFPVTYFGASVTRNVVMQNTSIAQSFFCILGEHEMQAYNLKSLSRIQPDFNYFKIYPEEGRLLPNDVRVFKMTYSPVEKKSVASKPYHLVMLLMERLKCKDLNQDDYDDDVFEPQSHQRPSTQRDFNAVNTPFYSDNNLDMKSVSTNRVEKPGENRMRILLYGEVEKVQTSVLPDAITLSKADVNVTQTRVLQISNNCCSLPITFRYKKIAFVDIKPKVGFLKPLQTMEVMVFITPRSYCPVDTHITIEFLYHNEPRVGQELVVVGKLTVPFTMDEKIVSKKNLVDPLLVRNFPFDKPNQRPNDAIMRILLRGDIYVALPDDRPAHNFPDSFHRTFKTIYSALPRYQAMFNQYALTQKDLKLLEAKNYYNTYINMAAKKVEVPPTEDFYYVDKCRKNACMAKNQEPLVTKEFIPLTPMQLLSIDLNPRSIIIENVAFDSTYTHTMKVTNGCNIFVRIYLRARKPEIFDFFAGKRFTIAPNSEKEISFIIFIGVVPVYNYELDVIFNNAFVIETTILVRARRRHLSLIPEELEFLENEPTMKFVEVHNELNVDIPFSWKIPNVFSVDPKEGVVRPGRFVACLVSFEVGSVESSFLDLQVTTEQSYSSLKIAIEPTYYKVRLPRQLYFEEIALNVPCYKTIVLNNNTPHRLHFEVYEKNIAETCLKVEPGSGYVNPWDMVHLVVCANAFQIGEFKHKIDITIAHIQTITCEATGIVSCPDLQFTPDGLHFRRMAASSFDIACITVANSSNVPAVLQFDTERFPEFSYSEFTDTPFMTNRDILLVKPKEEKKFTIHFYPFNPMVMTFSLPLIVNKISTSQKSKIVLIPNLKVHTQVLSYKLEVRSWRYNFFYFPYYNQKNVTRQEIVITNPAKNVVTFCVRLDELSPLFTFRRIDGMKIINYSCSIVVELLPDEFVTFEATYNPTEPGKHRIRLPVYIRDDFTQDMHNYFYFEGTYPAATYKFAEEEVHLGFVPLQFKICKNFFVDLSYHHPNCNCKAEINDAHASVEIDPGKPKSALFSKVVSIVFSGVTTHMMNAKLEMTCDCPGPNLDIRVYGGCENNYFTNHHCIQYFNFTSNMSLTAIFESSPDEMMGASTMSLDDPEKDESFKHSYKTDLPYFQSGTTAFDNYMRKVVEIFEQWLTEQVFFRVKGYTIPDSICVPDIKLFEKQGKREGTIKLPLQLILTHLLGPRLMVNFEIKYSEKRPLSSYIRRFYRDLLSYLRSIGCFVTMIKPEMLLTYELYSEYMIFMDRKSATIHHKSFYLLAKQNWLDLIMQCYKILVSRRLLQSIANIVTKSQSKPRKISSINSHDLPVSRHGGISITSGNIFSDEGILLLLWVDKNYQEYRDKFAKIPDRGSSETVGALPGRIDNFDEDLTDSLGIIACLLNQCSFLEEHIVGLNAPAKSRIEKFNNAYILIKLLAMLRTSFQMLPSDIIEPNTLKIIMFLTYLFDFLTTLKSNETIVFSAELSSTKVETIAILNDTKQRMYYNIIFFNNDNDLFSVPETQIVIEPDTVFRLNVEYYARFLRIQKTIVLLSGEIAGYQYTNSKIYHLQGRPILSDIPRIELKSVLYKVVQLTFDIQSPYAEAATYEIFLLKENATDITEMINSLISYSSILASGALMRCKVSSAFADANEKGKITITADLCSIINTITTRFVLFRNCDAGDFVVIIEMSSKPTKKFNTLRLTMQKALVQFPCTCPRRKPDVTNMKCPRTIKVMIPCRNEFMWKAVLEFFLATRDPAEEEFWSVYGNTTVGSHIIERILNDHKPLLGEETVYFMLKTFTYHVRTKNPDAVIAQKMKVIKEETTQESSTEIFVHLNEIVKSFYLLLESVDGKETRKYKVNVAYE